MAGEHAKLAPSSAKRWLVCPASAEAAARCVSPDTEYSLAGTAAHWVYSEWLLKGEPPAAGLCAPNGVEVTPAMVELVREPVMWVQGYLARAKGPCTILVEEKVQIGTFFGLDPSMCWGTADTIIMAPTELVVLDLKAGYVDVPVDNNEQLTMYALGANEELGWLWPVVRLVIAQPQQGGIKEWVTSREALQAKGAEYKPHVLEAASPGARYVPHEEGCRWCPAAGVCAALQRNAIELAKREFGDDPAVAIVQNISLDDLSLLLTKADLVETAIKAARDHAKKLLSLGQTIPGWKLVEGKSNRVWIDDATAAKALKEKGIEPYKEPPLITPAQAEKLCGDLDHLITKPKGAPTLVSETDKRPALAQHFDAIDTGNLLD